MLRPTTVRCFETSAEIISIAVSLNFRFGLLADLLCVRLGCWLMRRFAGLTLPEQIPMHARHAALRNPPLAMGKKPICFRISNKLDVN